MTEIQPGDNGNCNLSDGKVFGVVHTAWVNAQGVKIWELKYFQGEWVQGWGPAVGGILQIFGTAGKSPLNETTTGPNPFAAVVQTPPDVLRKLDSCLPPGVDSFQIEGVAVIAGLSPKFKA